MSIPNHIAIVMDGNGRWAKQRFLPRVAGHKQGVDALRQCAKAAQARGVRVLTVFAFSSENWSRPQDEVSGLMELFGQALVREVPDLLLRGVQLRVVGERAGLSDKLVAALQTAEDRTAHNTSLVFNVCFNYGGRWDIVQAAQALANAGQSITEHGLNSKLALAHVDEPDLLIRTGGEMRISNFLLWQCAYSELVFTPTLWPEFDDAALDSAIAEYSKRERRFGKTSEQVARSIKPAALA